MAKTLEYTGDPKDFDISKFDGKMKGSCLCGSIQVTLNDPTLFTGGRVNLCHCANCRKTGGTFAQANLMIEPEKVTIEDTKGTQKVYVDHGASGKEVRRNFCSNCGKYVD